MCTDATGHAEVVELTYDPAKVSYEQLLSWHNGKSFASYARRNDGFPHRKSFKDLEARPTANLKRSYCYC